MVRLSYLLCYIINLSFSFNYLITQLLDYVIYLVVPPTFSLLTYKVAPIKKEKKEKKKRKKTY